MTSGPLYSGGAEEDRTPDLRIANATLSQLSYRPEGPLFYHGGVVGTWAYRQVSIAAFVRHDICGRRRMDGAGRTTMPFLFTKLDGYTSRGKSSPGAERTVLRWMPFGFLTIILLCGAPSVIVRLIEWQGSEYAVDAFIGRVDMMALGIFFTLFNVAMMLTIGCVLIMLMKGPGYVADGYKLIDLIRRRSFCDKTRDRRPRIAQGLQRCVLGLRT